MNYRENQRYTSFFSSTERNRRRRVDLIFVFMALVFAVAAIIIAVKFYDVTADRAMYESYADTAKKKAEELYDEREGLKNSITAANDRLSSLQTQYAELGGE